MLNEANIQCRLVADPEIKTVHDKTVAQVRVASQRNFKNREGECEADFLNVVAWGKTAEIFQNYLAKGSECIITGRVQSRSYTTQEGQKRNMVEIVAERVNFCGSKNSSGEFSRSGGKTMENTDDIPF